MGVNRAGRVQACLGCPHSYQSLNGLRCMKLKVMVEYRTEKPCEKTNEKH